MNKIVFLSSPYSHEESKIILERVHKTILTSAKLLGSGVNIFSPIVHGHAILQVVPNLPNDWNFWQDYCKSFILVSEKLIVYKLEGWDKSIGVSNEILYATLNKIPIEYIEENFYL